jgi:hypothetical protein
MWCGRDELGLACLLSGVVVVYYWKGWWVVSTENKEQEDEEACYVVLVVACWLYSVGLCWYRVEGRLGVSLISRSVFTDEWLAESQVVLVSGTKIFRISQVHESG